MPATTQRPFELAGPGEIDTLRTQQGDIVVQGYAAVWKGLDLADENFIRGSFKKAIPEFLARPQRPLLWHHKYSQPLGEVLELKEDAKGLWFKGIVLKQEPSSPLYHAYNAIRRGVSRGVSVGGKFTRKVVAGGLRIVQANLVEISLTPAAVHQSTYAVATEIKSLRDWADEPISVEEAELRLDLLKMSLDLYGLKHDLRR